MKLTRREFSKSAFATETLAMMIGGPNRINAGEAEHIWGDSTISIKPIVEKNRFGVELSHRDFPNNIIRYRIPECWFCGLPPYWPESEKTRQDTQSPNVRYPYMVLGPFSFDSSSYWKQTRKGDWIGQIQIEGWWSCETTVTPGHHNVVVQSRLTNHSKWDWVEVWGHYCANMDGAPDFRDLNGDRTVVYLKDGARVVNQTHHYEGVGWRKKCNTYVPIGRQMPVREYLYGTPISRDLVASPLIIRQSPNQESLVAVCFRHYYGLFYDCHPENNCIHSEPYIGDLEAGESRTIRGHLYWLKGGIGEVVEKARRLDHVWVS